MCELRSYRCGLQRRRPRDPALDLQFAADSASQAQDAGTQQHQTAWFRRCGGAERQRMQKDVAACRREVQIRVPRRDCEGQFVYPSLEDRTPNHGPGRVGLTYAPAIGGSGAVHNDRQWVVSDDRRDIELDERSRDDLVITGGIVIEAQPELVPASILRVQTGWGSCGEHSKGAGSDRKAARGERCGGSASLIRAAPGAAGVEGERNGCSVSRSGNYEQEQRQHSEPAKVFQ